LRDSTSGNIDDHFLAEFGPLIQSHISQSIGRALNHANESTSRNTRSKAKPAACPPYTRLHGRLCLIRSGSTLSRFTSVRAAR